MKDGFYRVDYVGSADQGAGGFALVGGKVAGIDVVGITYVGTYERIGDELVGRMTAKAPPGTPLVTGATAGAQGATFPVELIVHSNGLADVKLPTGPVSARLTLISPL